MLSNISDRQHISLDNVCYLLTATITTDTLFNQVKTLTETACFCAELPVSSAEFYRAGQQAIKATKTLVVDTEEYGGQSSVKYNNVIYDVYRTYPASDGYTELYLTEKSGK